MRWVRSVPGALRLPGLRLCGGCVHSPVRCAYRGYDCAVGAFTPLWCCACRGYGCAVGALVPGGAALARAAVVQWVSVSSPDKASAPHPGGGRITPPRRIQLR
ncbi:hypothetical protein ACP3S7_20830 [Phytobacter ursingii]